MRRRDLLALAGVAALTPSTGSTQQAGRTYRLGFVAQQPRGGYAVLLEELGRLGFVEDRNLSVDPRGFGLSVEHLEPRAAEVAQAQPDAIFAGGDAAARAAQRATATIPIVTIGSGHDHRRDFTDGRRAGFLFYTTHVNDPLPAAVGLKAIEVVQRDGLAGRAAELGERLKRGLRALQQRYGCIGDVRGRGLLLGIEFETIDRSEKHSARALSDAGYRQRVEARSQCQYRARRVIRGVMRIAPPLTATEGEIDLGLELLGAALEQTLRQSPRVRAAE